MGEVSNSLAQNGITQGVLSGKDCPMKQLQAGCPRFVCKGRGLCAMQALPLAPGLVIVGQVHSGASYT
jgi:hypothetical protein